MVLDQGPTPLYHQLKNILKSRILSNELKGSQRLPTEAELCVEYNVSRITVPSSPFRTDEGRTDLS